MSDQAQFRDLLVALFGLQKNWFSAESLISCLGSRSDPSMPIGDRLTQQRLLSTDEYTLLCQTAEHHRARHADDRFAALNAVAGPNFPWNRLTNFVDDSLAEILQQLAVHQSDKTIDYCMSDDVAHVRAPVGDMPAPMGHRFRVLRFHRQGGLGFVSLAEDLELHRRVAVKQIRKEHAHRPEQQAKFLLEAEITGGLEHPNIVPVYGLGHDREGNPYYAMKFIQGDSLKDAIRAFHRITRCRVNDGLIQVRRQQLLQHFIDVCHAMHYAHTRGVLHRDLKPGNIMLGKYGETLIVDWGLARPRATSATPDEPMDGDEPPLNPPSASGTLPDPAGVAIGTPRYMAPEQAAGQLDRLGPWTDVYSLGATLYTLLTDQSPIAGEDIAGVLQHVKRGVFPSPRTVRPDVPRALEAICLKAMALRPEDRYHTTRELAADIERWIADEPVTAWREPLPVRLRRWARKHQTLVTSTAATLTVALGISVLAAILLNRAWQRAESNFQVAKSAVDQYFTQVSEDVLLNRAGMQPLRRELLKHAQMFYQDFLRTRGNDRNIQQEAGRTLYRLGRIHELTDRTEEASAMYRRAIARQETIVAASPRDAVAIADLALTWNALGRLLDNKDHLKEAQQAYQEARKLRQSLVARTPNQIDHRRWLANTTMNLGQLALRGGDITTAEQLLQESQELRESTAISRDEELPESFRLDLARGYYNLGRLDYQRGLDQESFGLDKFQLAIEQCQQLLQKQPHNFEYLQLLANSQRMLADCYLRLADKRLAAQIYRESLPTLQQLAHGNPDVPEYRHQLAGACINLATALSDGTVTVARGSYESPDYYWQYSEQLLEPMQAEWRDRPDARRDFAIVACRRAFQLAPIDAEQALILARRAEEAFRDFESIRTLDDSGQQLWESARKLIQRIEELR